MKLELKENMYIRNCYGRIAKIEYIEDNTAYCDNWLYQSYEDYITFINLNDEEDINEITKASYNIIDILEEGDYVNGYKVARVGGTYHGRKDKAIYCDYQQNEKINKWIMIYDDEIKSIVTKKQFEQMSYEVLKETE